MERQLLNLRAASAILGGELDELLTRRADALDRMQTAEKELADVNPRIAKLEACFATPVAVAPVAAS